MGTELAADALLVLAIGSSGEDKAGAEVEVVSGGRLGPSTVTAAAGAVVDSDPLEIGAADPFVLSDAAVELTTPLTAVILVWSFALFFSASCSEASARDEGGVSTASEVVGTLEVISLGSDVDSGASTAIAGALALFGASIGITVGSGTLVAV